MFKLLHKLRTKKFVFYIGENGVLISLYKKGKVHSSLQIKDINDENIKNLDALLKSHKKAPIYIIVDISGQNFKQIKIPSKNSFIVKKLLQRKIKKEFLANDINNYYHFKGGKKSKNSTYIVSSLSLLSPIKEWLDYLAAYNFNIEAIYSLPVEVQSIYSEIISYVKKKKNTRRDTADSTWACVVIQTKLGGFRIIITKNQQLVFSRLLAIDIDLYEEREIALESLRSQILGTVEFLRRLGFDDKEGINIFLLFTKALLNDFGSEGISRYNTCFLEQEEFISAKKKNKNNISIETYLCNLFLEKGKYFAYLTGDLKKFFLYKISSLSLSIFIYTAFFILIMMLIVTNINFSAKKNNIYNYEIKLENSKRSLEEIRQKKFGSDIDEDKIIEVVEFYNNLKHKNSDYAEYVKVLSDILPDNIVLKTYSWNKVNRKSVFKAKGVFISKGLGYEEIFAKYDGFLRLLKTKFKKTSITHSDLPNTISFEDNLKDIDINFSITKK